MNDSATAAVSFEGSLLQAPVRTPLTVRRADGSPEFRRRLAALGVRRGARVHVVHRTTGGGRIVSVAGARIALGRDVLERIHVGQAG
ncbi:MAG: FeoA family protein [Propionibacterium sp.]|nr:FeoA family protein [Propionibacterium sp.]